MSANIRVANALPRYFVWMYFVTAIVFLSACNDGHDKADVGDPRTTAKIGSGPTNNPGAILGNVSNSTREEPLNLTSMTTNPSEREGIHPTPNQEVPEKNSSDVGTCTFENPIANMPYCSGNAHHCQATFAACTEYCRSHWNPVTTGLCLFGCDYGFNECVASQLGGTTWDCDDFARAFKKYVCDPNGIASLSHSSGWPRS